MPSVRCSKGFHAAGIAPGGIFVSLSFCWLRRDVARPCADYRRLTLLRQHSLTVARIERAYFRKWELALVDRRRDASVLGHAINRALVAAIAFSHRLLAQIHFRPVLLFAHRQPPPPFCLDA